MFLLQREVVGKKCRYLRTYNEIKQEVSWSRFDDLITEPYEG